MKVELITPLHSTQDVRENPALFQSQKDLTKAVMQSSLADNLPKEAPESGAKRTARNFDVRLIYKKDAKILLVEASSDEGETVVEIPFEPSIFHRASANGTSRKLSSASKSAKLKKTFQTLEKYCQGIMKKLMPDEVFTCFHSNWEKVERDKSSLLRVRLFLYDPEVAEIPWESAFSDENGHLALLTQIPFVRYVFSLKRRPAICVTKPYRILGIVSKPPTMEKLAWEKEKKLMREALDTRCKELGAVTIDWLEKATMPDLRARLEKTRYHMVHFIGHGSYDAAAKTGLLHFEQAKSEVSAHDLANVLVENEVRFAFINACETGHHAGGIAERLVRNGLPAALGMRQDVLDDVAVDFSQAFYEALGNGLPVDVAVCKGRQKLHDLIADADHWIQPVLYMRSRDGVLFG